MKIVRGSKDAWIAALKHDIYHYFTSEANFTNVCNLNSIIIGTHCNHIPGLVTTFKLLHMLRYHSCCAENLCRFNFFWIRAKWNFRHISITKKWMLVKWSPWHQSNSKDTNHKQHGDNFTEASTCHCTDENLQCDQNPANVQDQWKSHYWEI